jgi:hypothetical protein
MEESKDFLSQSTDRMNVRVSPYAIQNAWPLTSFNPVSIYLDVCKDELTHFIIFTSWEEAARSPALQRLKKWIDILRNDGKFQRTNSLRKKKHRAIKIAKDPKSNVNLFTLPFRMLVELYWDSLDDEKHRRADNSNTGLKLERLGLGALIKTSAGSGPSGCSLQLFLPRFVDELQLVKGVPPKLSTKALAVLGDIRNQKVPFCLAVGHTMSEEFRAIPGVYTGTCPDVPNSARTDGLLKPDYVDYPGDPNAQEPLCQLYVTTEKKLYKIDKSSMVEIMDRGAKDGRSRYLRWKERGPAPRHHLHLIVVTAVADFYKSSLKTLYQKYSHAARLLKMTYNETTAELGLVDLFKDFTEQPMESSENEEGLSEELEHEAKKRRIRNQPSNKTEEETVTELANVHSPIGIPATDEFPRSTFLIIPIVDLFKYSFGTKDHLKQSAARSLK